MPKILSQEEIDALLKTIPLDEKLEFNKKIAMECMNEN